MARQLTILAAVGGGIVGLVLVLDAVLGPVYTSLLLAPVLWGSMIYGWSVVERRLFPTVQPSAQSARRVVGPVIDVRNTRATYPRSYVGQHISTNGGQ